MHPTPHRRFFGFGVAAALLVALVLGLQYAGSYYAVQLTLLANEDELARHLGDLGRIAGIALETPVLAMDDLALDSQWEAETQAQAQTLSNQPSLTAATIYRASLPGELTRTVEAFADRSRLSQVVILSAEGRVLYDTQAGEGSLRRFDFWEVDRLEVEAALHGELASTPAYSTADTYHQRTYVPIQAQASMAGSAASPAAAPAVGAVVCLVAGRDYLSEIDRLKGHLVRANAVLTLLMALIGLLIWQLLRRQRRMQRQVSDADRLSALGRLAAGFAHELRNPLGIVRAFTEDLQHNLRNSGGDPAALEACNDIIEEVDRMNRLVGQFLEYSHDRSPQAGPGRASVVAVTDSVLTMVRPSSDKKGLELRLEHPAASREEASRWRAGLEEGALRQVLVNLILNAAEVSPRGGMVRLAVEAGARHVRASVIDRGPGIAKADRTRIFEPFYSTRDGGSGLGLAISRQIVTAAGGSLEIGPAPPGGGACFVLTLPRVSDGTPGAAATDASGHASGRSSETADVDAQSATAVKP
jgi:signal transduction histidine kinase